MTNTFERPIEILLVEDSPTDVLLATEAFENAKVRNRLNVVGDGVQAMEFLHRQGDYQSAPRPDLVLLDLNLPRMDGREVLAAIRKDTNLRRIPVVILTTSKADQDVLAAYDLSVNAYITKPVDFEQFADVVRNIGHFWFHVVTLPPE